VIFKRYIGLLLDIDKLFPIHPMLSIRRIRLFFSNKQFVEDSTVGTNLIKEG